MAPWLDTTLNIGILLSMLVALLGSLIPIFPGPTVLWGLALIFGLLSGFDTRGYIFFGVISVIGFIGTIVDNVITIGSARVAGARWSSLILAILAGLLSSLLFTPVAGILVSLLVLFLAEYLHHKDYKKAWEATKSMLFGWGWTALARFGLGLLMIILWAVWAFR
ncbi:MAG: DUF456 family protein [Anaerolineae bacterium]|nr:DUF456 family protein [Anaerolineae bacterium]